MKTGFKDPTSVKNQKPIDEPRSMNQKSWNFECPQYDQRSSCFVNAGTHYGVGHNQPIGSHEHSSNGPIPMGKVSTMRIDEKG